MTFTKKAPKPSQEKQPVWGCSKMGCTVDTSKTICEHIERRLPQMRDGKLPVATEYSVSVATFDPLSNPKGLWKTEEPDLEAFRWFLRAYGFSDHWDMDLLVARYYYGMSLRHIQEEYNYVAFKTIARRLKHLHALLVERGIDKELPKK